MKKENGLCLKIIINSKTYTNTFSCLQNWYFSDNLISEQLSSDSQKKLETNSVKL